MEELVSTQPDYKLFKTKHNGNACSKISLKNSTTVNYEVLKSHSHPNVIPILKLSTHSIYTKPVTTLIDSIETSKRKYNEFILSKIKEALQFVHNVLHREHNSLTIESIFIDEKGMPLLGGFEKSVPFVNEHSDLARLDALSQKLVNKDYSDIEVDEDIFSYIEKLDMSQVSSMPIEDRFALIEKVYESKEHIPKSLVKYIYRVFLYNIEKESNKEYKSFLLEKLYSLDTDYFIESKSLLFSIADSTVRLFIFKKFQQDKSNKIELDDVVDDLSLGLRVKDKSIKKETIEFIFNNEFKSETMNFLFENMLCCDDSDSIGLICGYLLKNSFEINVKALYKLLYSYLLLNKNIAHVYRCIDRYCLLFDRTKLSKEILPVLCSRLIEQDFQDQCFSLVEKIINFLKENRIDTQSKEWSLKSISNIFGKKADPKEVFNSRVTKFRKDEKSDKGEWDETDIS